MAYDMQHPSRAIVNIEDLRKAREAPAAARGIRLHRRRSGSRDHARSRIAAHTTTSSFRPRCAVANANYSLRTTVLGTPVAMPFILAPVGSSRMFYPRGEEVAAHAAGEAGTVYILSTLSGCLLEDVQTATTGPAWYQLYLVGGRDVALARRSRAHARRATPRWSSPSTRRSPACANATCATA